MDEAAIIERARAGLAQVQEEALARSVLAGVGAWVSSGVAPSAAELRSAGLDGIAATDTIRLARKAFIRRWGFAIPCAEAVAALRGMGPLVEVGAGTGFWASILRASGHDVISTDIEGDGVSVLQMSAVEAILAHPERDVFCSWPSEGERWADEAVQLILPGRHLAIIGDGPDGVIGDAGLYETLTTIFVPMSRVDLPRFPGCRDSLTVYRKA